MLKVQDLHRDVMVEMIRAASAVACAKIQANGTSYNPKYNFFDNSLRDVVKSVEENLLKLTGEEK